MLVTPGGPVVKFTGHFGQLSLRGSGPSLMTQHVRMYKARHNSGGQRAAGSQERRRDVPKNNFLILFTLSRAQNLSSAALPSCGKFLELKFSFHGTLTLPLRVSVLATSRSPIHTALLRTTRTATVFLVPRTIRTIFSCA